MTEVAKHLNNILAIDRSTLIVICVLCAIAAYAIKDFMSKPIMAIFVYPMLMALSVVVHYVFILGELYPLKKMDQWLMWTVIASICGNVAGIILVASLGRLRDAVRASRPFKPTANPQQRR